MNVAMPRLLAQRVQDDGCQLEVDMTPLWGHRSGKPWKKLLRWSDVRTISFAMVSYGGSGKYLPSDRALPWDMMAQSELNAHHNVVEGAFFKVVEPPHFDQLIDNDGWHKQAEPPCDYKYGVQTDPPRGWWPVCIVN